MTLLSCITKEEGRRGKEREREREEGDALTEPITVFDLVNVGGARRGSDTLPFSTCAAINGGGVGGRGEDSEREERRLVAAYEHDKGYRGARLPKGEGKKIVE